MSWEDGIPSPARKCLHSCRGAACLEVDVHVVLERPLERSLQGYGAASGVSYEHSRGAKHLRLLDRAHSLRTDCTYEIHPAHTDLDPVITQQQGAHFVCVLLLSVCGFHLMKC